MKNLKSEKGISLIAIIVIIIAIIVVGIIIISSNSKPGYEMTASEAKAYTSLRTAIAQSTYDGNGFLEPADYELLGEMIKKPDSENEWLPFDSLGQFDGLTDDKDGYQYTSISMGSFSARFCVKQEGDKYYLCDYTMENKSIPGYKFWVAPKQ